MDCIDDFKNHLIYLKKNGVLINENVERLSQIILSKLKTSEISLCEEIRDGKKGSVEINGIPFHSRRDPYREANRQLDALIQKKGRHIIFVGAGLGYLLESSFKEKSIDSVLLIESIPEVFFYLINRLNTSLAHKKLNLYFTEDIHTVNFEEILFFMQGKNSSEILIHTHHPSFVAHENMVSKVNHRVKKLLEKRSINQATIIKFQKYWNKNIFLNTKEMIWGGTKNQLVEYLKEFIPQKDILIVGAGPSLKDSMGDIKKFRKNYLIFAADTAFLPLVSQKVIPDVVFAADPQWVNLYFAHSEYANQSVWLLDPVVISSLTHFLQMHNAPLFWWDNDFYFDAKIREFFGNRGSISHGGSVTTNAFSLASELAPNRIILVGQDLSFTGKIAHVKGAALEKRIYFSNYRLKGIENHNYTQLSALPKEYILSINSSEKVFTNAKMKVFIEWFQVISSEMKHKNHPSQLLNSTPKGALLNGFVHKLLEDIYEDKKIDFSLEGNLIDLSKIFSIIKHHHDKKSFGLKDFLDYLHGINRSIKKLLSLYEESIRLNQKLMQKQNMSIMDQLNNNDSKIRKYEDVNTLISLGAQNEILQITEHSSNTSKAELNAIKLYTAMHQSGIRMLQMLKKLQSILNNS